MKREEAEAMHRRELAKHPRRVAIEVFETGNEYVAFWRGQEVRASNPFGLDSALDKIGAPSPRNLYLIDEEVQS